MDEKKLNNHPFVKQKTKNALKNLFEAFEEQMNRFVYGDATTQNFEKMSLDAFEAIQNGLLELEEFFRVAFQLAELPEGQQKAFQGDYAALMKKYSLEKSLEEIFNN